MPMARMRRALTKAQALARVQDELPAYAQQAPQVPVPADSQQSVRANVWAEHAPPRLDASTVAQLQASFRSNYPGEHLDADCTPSIRLLSLVRMWFKPGGTIKWFPWQMRLSSKQYQDIIEARTSRTLRTEAQLISTALFDETPELPVEHVRLNASWLAGKQAVFRNAIALCNGAHLAVLKAFDKKVLDLCTQPMPASSGLRPQTRRNYCRQTAPCGTKWPSWSSKVGLWMRRCTSSLAFGRMCTPFCSRGPCPRSQQVSAPIKAKARATGVSARSASSSRTRRARPHLQSSLPTCLRGAATRRCACASTKAAAQTSAANSRTFALCAFQTPSMWPASPCHAAQAQAGRQGPGGPAPSG